MRLTDLKYNERLESILSIKLSDEQDELVNQLTDLAVVADSVLSDSIKKWICEKIDTGIIKLKSMGADALADSLENRRKKII